MSVHAPLHPTITLILSRTPVLVLHASNWSKILQLEHSIQTGFITDPNLPIDQRNWKLDFNTTFFFNQFRSFVFTSSAGGEASFA